MRVDQEPMFESLRNWLIHDWWMFYHFLDHEFGSAIRWLWRNVGSPIIRVLNYFIPANTQQRYVLEVNTKIAFIAAFYWSLTHHNPKAIVGVAYLVNVLATQVVLKRTDEK